MTEDLSNGTLLDLVEALPNTRDVDLDIDVERRHDHGRDAEV